MKLIPTRSEFRPFSLVIENAEDLKNLNELIGTIRGLTWTMDGVKKFIVDLDNLLEDHRMGRKL